MNDIKVLKWIYRCCGKRGGEITALVLLSTVTAVCVTAFAMLSKRIVDCAEAGDGNGLFKNALLLLALIVFQLSARVISSLLEAVSQGKAEKSLKTHSFSEIIYGTFAESSKLHSGEIMTRLTTDVSIVSDYSIKIIPALSGYAARIISAAAALLALDRRFAVVFIACAVLVSGIAILFRKPLKSFHKRVQEQDGKVRSFMQEMAENLFAVKIFGIEKNVIEKSSVLQKRLYREKIRKKGFSVFASIGFSAAFAAGFLAATAYGSYGLLRGTVTAGTVIALIQLVNQLQSPVMGITGILPSFFAMLASAQRLMELEHSSADVSGTEHNDYTDFYEIAAQSVTFGYDGSEVLKDADFTISKGDFTCIIGPSGAGKTTIFKLITGLYSPDSGKILIQTNAGTTAGRIPRKMFSVVPQGNMLFSGTIRENLTLLSPDATDEKLDTALTAACAEFVKALPDGLDTVLGEDSAGISEGQAQRIAIARALLGGRKIILMDEATSALDPDTEYKLLKNLKQKKDVTILFISHRNAVLDICDKIITVDNGRVTENVNKKQNIAE